METQKLDKETTESENRDLRSKSELSALLSAITAAEERWGTWGIGVEVYGDGSGRLHRDNRPAMEFTTIDKCFELLSR